MTRSIAGIFGSGAGLDRSRLAGSLRPQEASVFEHGPVAIAYTGAPAGSANPLCLLAGHLDDAALLAAELELGSRCSAEEVLAAGYRRWSSGLLGRLRGDFMLVIWDRERECGLIGCDQLGVRAGYLHDAAGPLCFATEVCQLLALLPRRPSPDPVGVAHWLAASSRAGAGTLYSGVRRLAPAGALALGGGRAHERRYWSPTFVEPVEPVGRGEPDRDLPIRDGIARAVERRLADGGATGVLMSGGLDSASVAAVAVAQAPCHVRAFSGVFPEHPAVDESELINELRRVLALPGTTAEVRAGGLLASALESQQAWQLPLLSWGDFWTLPLLRSAASDGVGMMLGGDGGDELFATRAYLAADRARAGAPLQALALARELPGAGERPPRRALAGMAAALVLSGATPYGLHVALRRRFLRRGPPVWLGGPTARAIRQSEDPLAWKRLDGPRWWAHAAHGLTRAIAEIGIFELHRHRAAMAGLQARHPLLDLDLVELVLRSPPLSTFDRRHNRPALRASMAGLLPDSVRLRARKALFDSLVLDTLSGPDGSAIRRLLSDRRAELGAYVDLDRAVGSLLEGDSAASSSTFQRMQHIWRLATAEIWLRAQADPSHERLWALVRPSRARVTLRREPSRANHRSGEPPRAAVRQLV